MLIKSAERKQVCLNEVSISTSVEVGCPFLEKAQLEGKRALMVLIMERLVCYTF